MIIEKQRILTKAFQKLHNQKEMLLLPNIWDAGSACIFEKQGFRALATSSAGIAYSLGYSDGEKINFEDIILIIKSIVNRINIPLSVDFERGYGESLEEFREFSRILLKCGISGLNIEDGRSDKKLDSIELMKEKIKILCELKKELGVNFVINARTCVYWLGIGDDKTRLETALERGKIFHENGADCIFIPGVEEKRIVQSLVNGINAPINLLINSKLHNYNELEKIGVKRLTSGSSPARYIFKSIIDMGINVKNKDFSNLLKNDFSYNKANDYFNQESDT